MIDIHNNIEPLFYKAIKIWITFFLRIDNVIPRYESDFFLKAIWRTVLPVYILEKAEKVEKMTKIFNF